MARRRYGTFTGGIVLPDEKERTLDAPIRALACPQRLLIPLSPSLAAPARPRVKPGESVSAGECIAEGDERALSVFAPLAGRVAGTAEARVPGREGWAGCEAIELRDLSPPEGLHTLEPHLDWREMSAASLRRRIAEVGLTTAGRPAHPLAPLLRRAREAGVRTLICNAVEGQPYVAAAHRLLTEQGTAVVHGMEILATLVGASDLRLAVDQRRTSSYRALIGPARRYGVEPVALPHKYPTGAPPILVKVLTRRTVPLGKGPLDVGALVVDPSTCFALYRWIACGEPPSHRVVTLAGGGMPEPGNRWVPYGTELSALAGGDGAIAGGPMVGLRAVEGAVVGPGVDAVLALGDGLSEPATPCIRCGWCTDHCPARLNVSVLNDAFEMGRIDLAERFVAQGCVECGVCTYVCPARLPLAQRTRQLKRMVGLVQRHMPLFAGKGGRR